jgi:hypothetical protein
MTLAILAIHSDIPQSVTIGNNLTCQKAEADFSRCISSFLPQGLVGLQDQSPKIRPHKQGSNNGKNIEQPIPIDGNQKAHAAVTGLKSAHRFGPWLMSLAFKIAKDSDRI